MDTNLNHFVVYNPLLLRPHEVHFRPFHTLIDPQL